MGKQKRVIGDFLRVPLGDGTHTYARVLASPSVAFYDARSEGELDMNEIQRRPVLFIVSVMQHAVTSGRWPRVGNAPLEEVLRTIPARFIQDALDRTKFRIYENDSIRPAERGECIGLERMAAWDAEHVEDRLRDHYAGRPNKWVESLRMR